MQNFTVLDENNLTTPFRRFVYLLRQSDYIPAEIADIIGVSESTVGRWLSGETKNVKPSKCKDYAKKLNLNIGFIESGRSRTGEPEVAYADEVDLPKDGKLSAGQMRELLAQIESIARILKDSL